MTDGTRVIITGAAQGMGREHCAYLARNGARVAALDNDKAALANAGEAMQAAGLDVHMHTYPATTAC